MKSLFHRQIAIVTIMAVLLICFTGCDKNATPPSPANTTAPQTVSVDKAEELIKANLPEEPYPLYTRFEHEESIGQRNYYYFVLYTLSEEPLTGPQGPYYQQFTYAWIYVDTQTGDLYELDANGKDLKTWPATDTASKVEGIEATQQENISNCTIGQQLKGTFYIDSSTKPIQADVYILFDYVDKVYHYSYLSIDFENRNLVYNLNDPDTGSYGDALYVCDVNGDGADEIVVQSTVGMTGGAGQYLSRIFKFEQGTLCEIFNSKTSLPLGDNSSGFDTGFSSEFQNGYKLKIANRYTGDSFIVDISNRYKSVVFDENGKCTKNEAILVDSFVEFVPKDIDNDGIYEIECLQYLSLFGHADRIGFAGSVLKYNRESQKFEVVQTSFKTQ